MDRIRGRRFDNEPKLNMKKVFATIIAIIVFVMVIISIKSLFKSNKTPSELNIQTSYFTVFENEKYGVIDNEGNKIIKPNYDEIIIIPNKYKDVFICTYDVNYENKTYNTKVLNSTGSVILTNYKNIEAIENSDYTGVWYEDNILTYKENELYGLIDFSGKKILPAEYTDIYALNGITKNIIVEKDGKKGLVNTSLGKLVLECEYTDIKTLVSGTADSGFVVCKDGKYGVLSATGKILLEYNYSEIKNVTGNNMYVVDDGTGLKIIDNALNIVKDGGFQEVLSINGENIVIKNNDKCGVINKTLEEKIPYEYEDIKFACDNYYIAKKDGLYGIISLDNTVCVDFKYASISFLNKTNFYQAENTNYTTDIISRNLEVKLAGIIVSELNIDKSYMRIRSDGEYKYYNFNFEEKSNIEVLKSNTLFLVKKDGKYGYVNKNGELVVNYIYDDAKEQNEYGYCAVKQDGLWGVLGQNGTVILKPSVNLDDSIYIEFISTWHLYNDADLNIFVK